MRKSVLFLLLMIVGATVFFVIKRNNDEDESYTYKTVTHNGVSFEIPDNFQEAYISNRGRYGYGNKTGTFVIAVESNEVGELTLEEYISMARTLYTTGSVRTPDGVTASWKADNITNILVTNYRVEKVNGVDMGLVIMTFKATVKDEPYYFKQRLYGILVGGQATEIIILVERSKEEKYQELMDHVVNSIKIQ